MTATNDTARRKYWMYFAISLVITLFMLFFVNEWFWAGLPFVLTSFVLALDKI